MFLVCGEALFDFFEISALESVNAVKKTIPNDPRTSRFDACAGGSCFNVALGLAALEQQVGFLGGVSTDALGGRLRTVADKAGVRSDWWISKSAPTPLSFVTLDAQGSPEYTFIAKNSADQTITRHECDALPIPDICKAIHFGSYSVIKDPTAASLFALARAQKDTRFISFDPNVRLSIESDVTVWRQNIGDFSALCDAIKISVEDICAVYPGESIQALAKKWLAMGVKLVVVTNGANNVQAYTKQNTYSVTPPKVNVIDTVGAGDAFMAALLMRLGLRELHIDQFDHDDLMIAAQAGAIACTHKGAYSPRLADLSVGAII